jgi:hypothetical protein
MPCTEIVSINIIMKDNLQMDKLNEINEMSDEIIDKMNEKDFDPDEL